VELEYLLERMGWLVQLRWFAVGGVLVTVVCAAVLRVVDDVVPLLGVTTGLATFNTYAWSRWRRSRNENSSRVLAHRVFWQLVGDLVALALLLHFSGGAQNPFAMFFAFHMALGAMLLPGTLPTYLGIIAALLHGFVVLGEFAGVLAHYSLFTVRPGPALAHQALLWRTPGFVVGYLVAFTMMLFGVIYFVRSVVERQRGAEELRRERERLAASRERLARIGEITAGVAHAVQNPLHGLINSVDLLIVRAAADAATNETLVLMGEACRRIERVTQRLLVLTRDAPVAKKTVRLESLIQEAVTLAWRPRTGGGAARVEMKLEAVGLVEADPDRLAEAFINVIDNALDACREGGAVTVRTVSTTADSVDNVCVEVADTGSGIAAENLTKVFDPFFTTKPVGEGTGLGLAITRRVVEEHGGEVVIESALGKGTRVRILIPRSQVERHEHGVGHERESPSSGR
jgi:signal transduction histidine kinase